MSEATKKTGSLVILSGLGGTLTAALIIWLFGNSYNNSITLAPLVQSVDRLAKSIDKKAKMDREEHGVIIHKLQAINGRINVNETKLHTVISSCSENHTDIKACQSRYYFKKETR